MPRLSVIAVSILLGATLSLPAAAQWKWRDHNGHTQYSDLPPPAGIAERDILQRPRGNQLRFAPAVTASAASGAALAPAKPVEPELEAKRQKAEQERAAKAKAEEERVAAARAENCSRAKGHLRTLDDGVRLARTKENGEREILDDKARAEEVQHARNVIASECK